MGTDYLGLEGLGGQRGMRKRQRDAKEGQRRGLWRQLWGKRDIKDEKYRLVNAY